jgi:uncharacterized repeat protein (TIGR03803 family)
MNGKYRAGPALRNIAILFAALTLCGAAQAHGLKVLYSFCQEQGCNYGFPAFPLTRDAAGNLYGITGAMPSTDGVVFELSPGRHGSWTFQKLYEFCAGCGHLPNSALVADVDGNLYGTSVGENQLGGEIYKLSPGGATWSYSTLHRFTHNRYGFEGALTYAGAAAGLPYDGVSPLYGPSATGGGTAHGTVFSLTPSPDKANWAYRTVFDFCKHSCRNGWGPFATLTMDGAGNLYGVTVAGGKANQGVVFKLTPGGKKWDETVLHDFCHLANCADGMAPLGNSVAFDGTGNLYGTTPWGGMCLSAQCGVAYKLAPDGKLTVIHEFDTQVDKFGDVLDGNDPAGGLVADSGRLLGVTAFGGSGGNTFPNFHGSGTIFALSDKHRVLYNFCSIDDCSDGVFPVGPLVGDGKGHFYGVTQQGGGKGAGEIFEFTP